MRSSAARAGPTSGIGRLQDYASSRGLATDVVDLGKGGYGNQLLAQLGATAVDQPVVVLRTGRLLRDPDGNGLDRALGLVGATSPQHN